ncbi:MAG: PTS sugar transporter subunit IIA [Tissierellia bacterium]|nr:PTS sugar transporter subunit IIA [Tissierellia bacterium]
MTKILVQKDLVVLDLRAESKDEVLRKLGSLMINKGYAKEGYIEALIEREKEFPTGLVSIDEIGIAIPHTDAHYVNNSAIAVGLLENIVPFGLMGGMDNDLVNVEIVFLLAINNPCEQLNLLQNLIGMFQKRNTLKKIKEAENKGQIVSILNKELIK